MSVLLKFEKIGDSDYNVTFHDKKVGNIFTLDDGYYYYFPLYSDLAQQAWFLRAIADELDYLNSAWDKQVKAELAKLDSQICSVEDFAERGYN